MFMALLVAKTSINIKLKPHNFLNFRFSGGWKNKFTEKRLSRFFAWKFSARFKQNDKASV